MAEQLLDSRADRKSLCLSGEHMSISQLKSQIFPSEVNIGITFIRWTVTRLQMNDNVALCLPVV